MFKGEWYIFGARSTAAGMIRALRSEYPECKIVGVIVSSTMDNPRSVEGVSVEDLSTVSSKLSEEQKANAQVLIATPVYVQREIIDTLKIFGFKNIMPLDSATEAEVMKKYYDHLGLFKSLKGLSDSADEKKAIPKTCILEVWHDNADPLYKKFVNPEWVHSFHAGISDTDRQESGQNLDAKDKQPASLNNLGKDIYDSCGENIASRNTDFCELTALYWAWKNISASDFDYVGTSQYRRNLDITDSDLATCKQEDIDVVLPYPMLHVPNIYEHHTRYTNEAEWDALLAVIAELYPEYYADIDRIFGSQYMYNYNMLFAKKAVFDDYCEWLFSILFRLEETIIERKITPAKPYIPFFGESLLTLYFMHNAYRLKIRHTGRILRL